MGVWAQIERIESKRGADASAGYCRLVSIDLRHEFYNRPGQPDFAGPCRNLAIEPTAKTAERLARYGLLVRMRPDGIDILATGEQADALADVLEAIAAGPGEPGAGTQRLFEPPLLFTLRLLDPAFLNFTALPPGVGKGETSLLFSNLGNRAQGAGMGEAAMAPPQALACRHPDHLADPQSRQTELEAASERARLPRAAMLYEPSAGVIEAEAERDALLSDPRGTPFAIVEIHLVAPKGGTEGALYPVRAVPDTPSPAGALGRGHVVPVRYVVGFEPRSTRWRYVVVDRRGALDLETLEISDPARPDVHFARDPAPAVPGAVGAIALTSDEALPFLEHPPTHFGLAGRVKSGGRRSGTLISALPAASRSLIPAPGPGGGEVSTIYVYL